MIVLGLTLVILNFFIAFRLICSLLLFINGTLVFISEIETQVIPLLENQFFSFLGGVFPILIFAIFCASINFFSSQKILENTLLFNSSKLSFISVNTVFIV